jgi:hypothetical protein
MGGNPHPDELIVFNVDAYHKPDITTISTLAESLKGNRARLTVKNTHEKASYNFAIFNFKTIGDGII